jgi:hypothetical protein
MDGLFSLAVIIGGIATYFVASAFEKKAVQEIEMVAKPSEDMNVCDEGIDMVSVILKRHRAFQRHHSIVNSMMLMVHARDHGEGTLEKLIPPNDHGTIEIGKMFTERFISSPSRLIWFLAGVIELEMDAIRTGTLVPTQDVYEIRKVIDVFYYKFDA